jgi:hypothetical protein
MRKFKSMCQAQRFLSAHAAAYNLFNLGRHLASVENYKFFERCFFVLEKGSGNVNGTDGSFFDLSD